MKDGAFPGVTRCLLLYLKGDGLDAILNDDSFLRPMESALF